MTSPSLKRPFTFANWLIPKNSPKSATSESEPNPEPDMDRTPTKRRCIEQPIVATTPTRSNTTPRRPVNTPTNNTPRRSVNTPTNSPRVEPTQSGESTEVKDHPHLSYKFLYPPMRYDIHKRPPEDPDYDEKTLYVPESFLNAQTPALRQWWLIKQKNMDAILFFKMGKFYELFNEDAVIGVNNLDIAYMKGDESRPAHAGFPEVSYEKYSKALIDKGFKVIRIEQTETPAMMEERCQETGRRGKFDKVVKREVCRVTTKGTQMLGIMESVFHTCQNQYLLAICETTQMFGVCFIDVTVSKLYMGQFEDDNNQSKLNILLAHHTPTEILYEKGNLTKQTYQTLVKSSAILTPLKPSKEFWPIKKALSHLKVNNIFQDDTGNFEWPPFLSQLFEEGDSSESILALEPRQEFERALNSFGAIVFYLQSQMIAAQTLSCLNFEIYQTPFEKKLPGMDFEKKLPSMDLMHQPPPMILDHIALRNLEIFVNSAGGTESTLFSSINYCKTHFGQRLLKNWLCSPLCDARQINNRLDAVGALISNENASLMNEFVHVLSQTPDLERLLSKLKSQCFKSDSDARAIMFDGEQYSKAKITSFLNLLSNFKRLQKFIVSISKTVQNCESQILKRLLSFTTDGGLYPDYSATLDYFETAFDHDIARKTGKIIPASGVDKAYDKSKENIDRITRKLDDYLEEQKDVLKCRHIEFYGTGKNRFQIQVPEPYCKKVPAEYRIETTRKGVKRYYTPKIEEMFQRLTTYEEEMKRRLDGIMSTIFERFSRKIKLWSVAIECMAILDVLQSMASFVRSLVANDVDICRPKFLVDQSKPIIEYTNGRHPALVKMNPNYIANDLELDDRLLLLSGANMGGKSTLMRQTALLVVLAQMGCYVPASKMSLTPVDRIFSRLGANDRLLEGESTFYTELVETSAMLSCATKDSLLLLDELGRGTSTYDGTAIAYSVLQEISSNIKCRCLFSTHYHTLVRDFQTASGVRLAHMACRVENTSDDGIDLDPLKENITFLYKLAEGPVGRSYGFNVAKLAGIKDEIIKEAFKKANELEFGSKVLEKLQKMRLNERPNVRGSDLRDMVLNSMVN